MAERCYGIIIEGIGAPDSRWPLAIVSSISEENRTRMQTVFGPAAPSQAAVREGLTDRNGTIDTTIDPFRVRESHGSFMVRVVATDYLGGILFKKAYQSVSKLPAEIDDVSTTINLFVNGLDNAPFDIVDPVNGNFNIVYVGNETILLPEGSNTVLGNYVGVIRGAFFSTAGYHAKNTYVYHRKPSYWGGRKVWLFDWVETRTPQTVFREVGRLDNGFEMDKGNIIVRVTSHLSSLEKRTVNTNPYKIQGPDNGIAYTNSPDFTAGAGLNGYFAVRDYQWGMNVVKNYRTTTGSLVVYPAVFVQNGTHCQYYDNRGTSTQPSLINFYSRNLDSAFLSEIAVPGDELAQKPIDPHVLFAIVNPNYKTWNQDGYQGELRRPNSTFIINPEGGPTRFIGATEGFKDLTINADIAEVYKYHPVAIAAAMMMSTRKPTTNPDEFDILAPNWSMDARDSFSSTTIAEIHALIRANPSDQIQYLVLGKDGQAVRAMDVIRNMLQTYGYRLVVDKEGYLSFAKVNLVTVSDWAVYNTNTVTAIASDLLSLQDGTKDVTTRLYGKYGETPFFAGNSLEVNSQFEGTLPAIATLDENEFAINADTIAEIAELRPYMETRVMMMDFQCPRLKFRVDADTGTDLGLGKWVNPQSLPLKNAWLFDNDGNRVATINASVDNRWIGQIIGRRYLINDNAYEIEMIFLNEKIIRWRAPSAKVSGAPQTANTRLSIFNDYFQDSINDVDRFTVGDEVVFVADDGTLLAGSSPAITAIGPDYLEFGTNVSIFNTDGVWIELANYANYENSNVVGGTTRAYAYMGATNGTLGTSEDPGDIYG